MASVNKSTLKMICKQKISVQCLFLLMTKKYLSKLEHKRDISAKKLRDSKNKVIVTDFSLDHWYAQSQNLDIHNIPPFRPPHINKTVYEMLKKYAIQTTADAKDAKKSSFCKTRKSASVKNSLQSQGSGNSDVFFRRQATVKYDQPNPLAFPRTKKLDSFIDSLPQEFAVDIEDQIEMDNFQRSKFRIQKDRSKKISHKSEREYSFEDNQSNNSQIQQPTANKAQRKEIIKQSNFIANVKPSQKIQRRMNSSLNEIMSRSEIEKAARKAEKFPSKIIQNSNIVTDLNTKFNIGNRKFSVPIDTAITKYKMTELSKEQGSAFHSKRLNSISVPKTDQLQTIGMINRNSMICESQRSSKTSTNIQRQQQYQLQNVNLFQLRSPKTKIKQLRENDFGVFNNYQHQETENLKSYINFKHKSALVVDSQASTSIFQSRKVSQVSNLIATPNKSSPIKIQLFQNSCIEQSSSNISPFNIEKEKMISAFGSKISNGSPKHSQTKREKIVISQQQIESEEKEPVDAALQSCNLQMMMIEPDPRKVKAVSFQDPEYWLNKGYLIQRYEGIEVALDYYLQGVRVSSSHYPCIYNLSCTFFKTEKLLNSRKWFDIGIKIQPSTKDAYYGSALCNFRLGNFQQALDTLNSIPLQSKEMFVKNEELTYFKAMCYKKLKMYDEAQREYKSLNRVLRLSEGKRLIKYVFSICILPLQSNKKLIEDYLQNFNELQDLYNPRIHYNKEVKHTLEHLYEDGNWLNVQESTLYLLNFNFFKRFTFEKLAPYLSCFKLHTKCKDDLIFIEDEVAIILNGRVVLRSHENSALEHKYISQYIEGQLLGYEEGDNGLSKESNRWAIVASKKVNFVSIKRSDFEKLLRISRVKETEVFLQVLQKINFISLLQNQTQQTIAYELEKYKTFSNGELIMCQHFRSPLNQDFCDYYNGKWKIQNEIEQNMKNGSSMIVNQRTGYVEEAPSLYEGYLKAVNLRPSAIDLQDIQKLLQVNNQEKKVVDFKRRDSIKIITKKESIKKQLTLRRETIVSTPFKSTMSLPKYFISEFDVDEKVDKEKKPILIIMEGKCQVINPYDKYNVATLTRGDVIGESDFIRNPGFDYFGDIYAGEQGVKCLVIEDPEVLISMYERFNILKANINKYDGIKHILEQRYGIDKMAIYNY